MFDTDTFEHCKRNAYWRGFNAFYGEITLEWMNVNGTPITIYKTKRVEADDNPYDMQCQPELYHEWHRGWKFAHDCEYLELYDTKNDDEEWYYGTD